MIEVRKYRIYPYPDQEGMLCEQLETCRRLWNKCLGWRKEAWQEERISIGSIEQMREITQCKKSNHYLANVYSHVAQDVIKRLDKAFISFFKHIGRYPKFKKYGTYTSITYPDAYNGSVKLGITRNNTKIYLSKIGYVPVIVHREPPEGKNQRCTVKKESNKWYVILEYKVPDIPITSAPIINPIGGDLGLTSTLTMSNGASYDPPSPLKHKEKRIKHLQRVVSRKKKGSRNRRKAIIKLGRAHNKISEIRRDSNHKVSKELADNYDLVVLEDLRIRNMVKNHCFAKAIQDRGWGQLSRFIQYKMERQGKTFVQVPPQYTSQICSSCGNIQDMPLNIRKYNCPACGITIGRDHNAAKNILGRGLSQVGQDMADLMPVERGVQFGWTTTSTQPLNEPGTTFVGG